MLRWLRSRLSEPLKQTVTFRKCRHACLDRLVSPPFRNLPMHRQLLCSPCVFLLAVRTHASEAAHRPSEQITGLAIAAADSSLVRCRSRRCRSRAPILVALVTCGVVCHAQMPRPDASDVKSCETELASCQALLGSVGGKEATDVVHLAAISPSSKSSGARCPAAAWPSHAWTA
jgi:hypothetical protein